MEELSVDTAESEPRESPLRILFRFEPHTAELGYEFDPLEDLRDIFKIGEKNIIFIENGGSEFSTAKSEKDFTNYINHFEKGNRYGNTFATMRLLMLHSLYTPDLITQKDIDHFNNNLIKNKNGNPDLHYLAKRYLALDELEREGYDIDPLFEKKIVGTDDKRRATDNIFVALASNDATPEQMDELVTFIHERDQEVVRQLEDLRLDANTNKRNTNIYVPFGTLHNTLFVTLPESLQQCVVRASSDDGKDLGITQSKVERIYEGLYAKAEEMRNH